MLTDPVESAAFWTAVPPGKVAVTVSPGTNPSPVRVVLPPAGKSWGLTDAVGRTVRGPRPMVPVIRPTPYSVCAPPGSGDGNGNVVVLKCPVESAVAVPRRRPFDASRRMSTCSDAPKPDPETEINPPGCGVSAVRFQTIVAVGVIEGLDMPHVSVTVTLTATVLPAVDLSGVGVGASVPAGAPLTVQA